MRATPDRESTSATMATQEREQEQYGPRIYSDFFCMSEGRVSTPMLALKFSRSGRMAATALEQKGWTQFGVTFFAGFIQKTGVRMFINKSDGEPATKALKDVPVKAAEGDVSVSQESPVGDRQANGAIGSYSSDGRHVVRMVPCAPKVPHAPKENQSRTRPSGLRPAEMRRRKYFVEAQTGAAEAEQRTRRWKKSTESGGNPLRVGEVHKEWRKSTVRTREEGAHVQGAVLSSFASTEIDHLKNDKKKGKQSGNGTQEPLKKTARDRDPRTLEE